MSSHFETVQPAAPIEVFKLVADYNADDHPNKVNLSVGAYRDEDGKPWVLPVVKDVEAQMSADNASNHEYLPVAGLPSFREAACRLLLGEDNEAWSQNRVEGIQVLGGTGGIRLAAEFLKKVLQKNCVYISKPTWPNHRGVFTAVGYSNIKEYRYWNEKERNLDFNGMITDLTNANEGDVVILHACAHNPTGCDPSQEQWAAISEVCLKKKLFVLMDSAYQGFMSGDLDADAWAVRYFVKQGHELFISTSFSKNFGLYSYRRHSPVPKTSSQYVRHDIGATVSSANVDERIGNLCIVMKDPAKKNAVRSQMEIIIRQMWSNPSNHGAKIVATVLNNPALCSKWKDQLSSMARRINEMRTLIADQLKALGTPGSWEHMVTQQGMFTYTGLNPQQVKILKEEFHIYLMNSGRISMPGLNKSNVKHVAGAIHKAVTGESNASNL